MTIEFQRNQIFCCFFSRITCSSRLLLLDTGQGGEKCWHCKRAEIVGIPIFDANEKQNIFSFWIHFKWENIDFLFVWVCTDSSVRWTKWMQVKMSVAVKRSNRRFSNMFLKEKLIHFQRCCWFAALSTMCYMARMWHTTQKCRASNDVLFQSVKKRMHLSFASGCVKSEHTHTHTQKTANNFRLLHMQIII